MPGWSVVSVRSVPRRVEQVIAVTDSVTCGNRVNLGTRTAPAERANVRGIRGLTTTPSGISRKDWAVTHSSQGPVGPSHTPLTDDERTLLDTDAELSRVMEQALVDKDIETLTYAMAEKLSIERAFQSSRWETFNHRMDREFFGGDA